MAHRLSKITTRTGDAGETGLGDGSRVPKDSARIDALGRHRRAQLGARRCCWPKSCPTRCVRRCSRCSTTCSTSAASVSIPGHAMLTRGAGRAARSRRSRRATPTCRALKEFILPGGSRAAAPRTSRAPCAAAPSAALVALGAPTRRRRPRPRRYLNRLSDLLFVARPGAQPPRRARRRAVAPRTQKIVSETEPRPRRRLAGGLRQPRPRRLRPAVPRHLGETVRRRATYIEA